MSNVAYGTEKEFEEGRVSALAEGFTCPCCKRKLRIDLDELYRCTDILDEVHEDGDRIEVECAYDDCQETFYIVVDVEYTPNYSFREAVE